MTEAEGIYFPGRPYGFEAHLRHYGNGDNLLRTNRLAQSRALKAGDVLANGVRLLSDPRQGYNGGVEVSLGMSRTRIPARIPVALFVPGDDRPHEVSKGDILATGEKVLSDPIEKDNAIRLHLSSRLGGVWIDVPLYVPIAVLTPEDNAPQALWERHKSE